MTPRPLLTIGLLLVLAGCSIIPAESPVELPVEYPEAVTYEEEPEEEFCEEATVNVNSQSRKTWDSTEPKPSILCWFPSKHYGDHCKIIGYGPCTKVVKRPKRCFFKVPGGERIEVTCPTGE